jgi:hypothetical protein
VSVIPVPSRQILIRSAQVSAIALTFACVGPLIELALLLIALIGHVALTGITVAPPFAIGLTLRQGFIQPLLIPVAVEAGLTGLLAGVCDAVFGRVNVRSMLVISLVVVFVDFVFLVPLLIRSAGEVVWVILVSTAIQCVCFVVAMMACWKLIDVARDRIPAAGRLLGQ